MASPVRPNVKYSFADLERIRAQHPDVSLEFPGYAWRMELDGTMMLVRWNQATSAAIDGQRQVVERTSTHPDLQSESLPAIRKRTPAERIASVMAKVSEDFKAGRVFTLDEVNKNRPGRAQATELSGEVVKEVVQTFMEEAEARNEAAEAKRVTRTASSD